MPAGLAAAAATLISLLYDLSPRLAVLYGLAPASATRAELARKICGVAQPAAAVHATEDAIVHSAWAALHSADPSTVGLGAFHVLRGVAAVLRPRAPHAYIAPRRPAVRRRCAFQRAPTEAHLFTYVRTARTADVPTCATDGRAGSGLVRGTERGRRRRTRRLSARTWTSRPRCCGACWKRRHASAASSSRGSTTGRSGAPAQTTCPGARGAQRVRRAGTQPHARFQAQARRGRRRGCGCLFVGTCSAWPTCCGRGSSRRRTWRS
jgi:hypothetical protein